ncbi:N-acetylmuramoyl-L-alanine amidase [Pedobacter sp. HMF7647]|uniref:N-acetylmuramoyl-L-alanine amidase n=1 Tax=Hufsiella arboris TaxID=2695275 RepID=A0A7K1YEI3_9SPHI|nr:N-acetylmuramoyl-L-alanine amidase [Hufsiella arboris]MXV52439.1 N-acetylmuramoyl-L-alanine amidase [Hufsiella arboris]
MPLRRVISSLLILFLHPFVSSAYSAKLPPYRIKTIVIDAGHGGKDGVNRGIYSKEKDVSLSVALKLGQAIESNLKDVRVIYTRSEDVFIPLYERMNIANRAKADLFISIHCNNMPVETRRVQDGYTRNKKGQKVPVYRTISAKSTSTHGVETFVAGSKRLGEQDAAIRENAAVLLESDYKENYDGFDPNDPESAILLSLIKSKYRDQSFKFASLIQDEYIKTGRVDRGVQEQSLAVLRHATMPAVLTEIGFLSNPEEEDYLNSENGQTEVVNCLLNAIQGYKKQVELE